MNETQVREKAILDCIRVVNEEPELPGPMPAFMRDSAIAAGPEMAARGTCRATKTSIARNLKKLLEMEDHSYYLVTYERLMSSVDNVWQRENEVIKGCPGSWWSEHLRDRVAVYQDQKERFQTSGRVVDTPVTGLIERRFLFATSISKAAYEALS